MLLSDSVIKQQVALGTIKFGPLFNLEQIQSSSVDFKVGKIYVPDVSQTYTNANFLSLARTYYNLEPGGSVIVELQECLELDAGFGGLMLPPNRLSKTGIIMTNPGHIDPGYKGLLTVCLINMGAGNVSLKQSDTVATLLIHRLEGVTAGYLAPATTGVTAEQLSKFAKDFADISNRSEKTLRNTIWKHMVSAVTVASFIIAILAIIAPGLAAIVSQSIDKHYAEAKSSDRVNELTKRLSALEKAQELSSKTQIDAVPQASSAKPSAGEKIE
jgi:deoxycytidine triphosphate deaminase